MKEYKLRTIKDIFDNVPADRINDCLQELATLMATAKQAGAFIESAISLVSGKEVADIYIFPDEIVWRDDGKRNIQAGFADGMGGTMLTIEINKDKS